MECKDFKFYFDTAKPVIYGLESHFMDNFLCIYLDLMLISPSFVRPPAFYGDLLLKKLVALQNMFYCTRFMLNN